MRSTRRRKGNWICKHQDPLLDCMRVADNSRTIPRGVGNLGNLYGFLSQRQMKARRIGLRLPGEVLLVPSGVPQLRLDGIL